VDENNIGAITNFTLAVVLNFGDCVTQETHLVRHHRDEMRWDEVNNEHIYFIGWMNECMNAWMHGFVVGEWIPVLIGDSFIGEIGVLSDPRSGEVESGSNDVHSYFRMRTSDQANTMARTFTKLGVISHQSREENFVYSAIVASPLKEKSVKYLYAAFCSVQNDLRRHAKQIWPCKERRFLRFAIVFPVDPSDAPGTATKTLMWQLAYYGELQSGSIRIKDSKISLQSLQ
jgi:hypothetical protein